MLSLTTTWATQQKTLWSPVLSKDISLRQSNDLTAMDKIAMGMPTLGLTIADLETVGHLRDRVNLEHSLDVPFSRKLAVEKANLQ